MIAINQKRSELWSPGVAYRSWTEPTSSWNSRNSAEAANSANYRCCCSNTSTSQSDERQRRGAHERSRSGCDAHAAFGRGHLKFLGFGGVSFARFESSRLQDVSSGVHLQHPKWWKTIGTFRRWVMTFSESITWYIYVLGLLVKELENPEVEAEDEEKDIQSDGEAGASRIFELFGVNLYMWKGHHKSPMWCQMLWSATFSSMQWQI